MPTFVISLWNLSLDQPGTVASLIGSKVCKWNNMFQICGSWSVKHKKWASCSNSIENVIWTLKKKKGKQRRRRRRKQQKISCRVISWWNETLRCSPDGSIYLPPSSGSDSPIQPILRSRLPVSLTVFGSHPSTFYRFRSSSSAMATMEGLIGLVNRIQRACMVLGDHCSEGISRGWRPQRFITCRKVNRTTPMPLYSLRFF